MSPDGLFRHVAEPGHELLGAARAGARRRAEYPVTVADRAARRKAEGAANDDRRMRVDPKRLHAVGEQLSIPSATVSFGELLALRYLDIIDMCTPLALQLA